MSAYVHGYSDFEATRLADQADTLAELLHADVRFPAGSRVLEAGCGIGAQTVHLAGNNPAAHFLSFDLSAASVAQARVRCQNARLANVQLEEANVYALPYAEDSFDHIFVCFLLEHLENPAEALRQLRRLLKTGGSITVIEGDHGSYYCHPQSAPADHVVQAMIDVQARKQGNALIGRSLYPLLTRAGFSDTRVHPRMVYVDSSRPDLVEGFIRRTFIAMVEGVKEEALALGLSDEKKWARGIQDLHRTTGEEGTFCYTFFRAIARKH